MTEAAAHPGLFSMIERALAVQGTNAHAVVEIISGSDEGSTSIFNLAGNSMRLAWQRARLWVLPPAHALLHKVAERRGSHKQHVMVFQANMGCARAAHLLPCMHGRHPTLSWGVVAEVSCLCCAFL